MRALVAYGTRYGSTKGIAERIGKVLKEKKVDVMVEEAEKVSAEDIWSHDMIIIGSAIIMGKWLKQAEKLIASNEAALAGKKTAVFVCCMDAADPTRVADAKINYLDNVLSRYPSLAPLSTGLFAGVVDFNAYGFIIKKIMKSEVVKRGLADSDMKMVSDLRDWNAIETWTESLLEHS
ncbi:MAG: flavodoxin domain-containing protein [Methanomassiliicoccales archaeon]|jgi:menaquinone-dependent protoporphyrinogen oxidase